MINLIITYKGWKCKILTVVWNFSYELVNGSYVMLKVFNISLLPSHFIFLSNNAYLNQVYLKRKNEKNFLFNLFKCLMEARILFF